MSAQCLDPMRPRFFRVERVRRELRDVQTFDLRALDGAPLPFAPGQFTMLYMHGTGEIPISISGDPAHPCVLTHTVRDVGPVSSALCRLRRDDTVGVRGPFGRPWPLAAAAGHDVVVVAGGLGLAPLRPAIYSLLAGRAQYGNIAILYGARTPSDLLYPQELEHWRGRFDLQVAVTVDRAAADWLGPVGVVPQLIPKANFDPTHTVALVCGPEIMMRFTVAALEKAGVDRKRIYLSMERNMKCGIGLCGHCQWGPYFICKDGPVFAYNDVAAWFNKREA